MRIAIVTGNRRCIGGVETYLNRIIPALHQGGQALAFWCEQDAPADREPIALPSGTPFLCVADLGEARALSALSAWRPDLIYSQGLHSPRLEALTLSIAPTVYFAHDYHGTCISGSKAFSFPVTTPCHRRFGTGCLLHYYPHRCGGLNPLTMWQLYRRQRQRQQLLGRYRRVLTASQHMRDEYVQHGVANERATCLPYLILAPLCPAQAGPSAVKRVYRLAVESAARPARLLFMGRMERLKGGQVLLEALPRIRAALARSLHVVFAGDGPERERWQERAGRIMSGHRDIAIDFVGWITAAQRDAVLAAGELLVVPSLWPEPFGLIGLEAAQHGLPAVAFDVGGIRAWLRHGVNGMLAAGNPPTAAGLADAVVGCLADAATYAALSAGARSLAQEGGIDHHLNELMAVFADAVSTPATPP